MGKRLTTLIVLGGLIGMLSFSFVSEASAHGKNGPHRHTKRPLVECLKHPIGCKGSKTEALADVLDMSTDELEEAIESGKTVRDLIEEKELSKEDFRDQMREELRDEWKNREVEWREQRIDLKEKRREFCERHPRICFWKK